MSREIKFRAWDEEKGIILYDDMEDYAFYHDGVNMTEVEMVNKILNYNMDNWDFGYFEFMQYTGIKDKNGKEIYEGDIVKIHQFLFDGCEYEKEIIVSIEYMDDMACFGANLLQAKEIRAYMGYDNKTDKEEKVVVPLCNFYGLHEESFEVIGNIYENADLLE